MSKVTNKTAAPAASAPERTPRDEFEEELAQRFPNRLIRNFRMPTTVREAREVYILEITSKEEIQAATFADATMSLVEKSSMRLTADAERRECIRLAIVGLVEGKVGERERFRHVNDDGAPFGEINSWSAKATTALHAFFGVVNGVPTEEIAGGIAEARTVGAFAPPRTNATPSAAEPGR